MSSLKLLSPSKLQGLTSLRSNSRSYSKGRVSTDIFKDAKSAQLLASAGSSSTLPRPSGLSEVIVTGRANVGKSSLLNAVLGRNNLLWTGKKAGRTKTFNFFRVGAEPGKLVVVDAPGYGERGRPEWGQTFDHYLQHRPVLRRVYVLLNGGHSVSEVDLAMLQSLDARCRSRTSLTLQAVITKADRILADNAQAKIIEIRNQILEVAPTCLPPIVTSARKPAFGIDEMRRSITEACSI